MKRNKPCDTYCPIQTLTNMKVTCTKHSTKLPMTTRADHGAGFQGFTTLDNSHNLKKQQQLTLKSISVRPVAWRSHRETKPQQCTIVAHSMQCQTINTHDMHYSEQEHKPLWMNYKSSEECTTISNSNITQHHMREERA